MNLMNTNYHLLMNIAGSLNASLALQMATLRLSLSQLPLKEEQLKVYETLLEQVANVCKSSSDQMGSIIADE